MKSLIIIVILILAVACVPVESQQPAGPEAEPLRVVATIFPQFDFVRQIAGDKVELSMMISPGAESHSFEPTPRDMVTLNNADLLIYLGGDSDTWVDTVLASLEREDMRTVALVELVEGIWQEVEHQEPSCCSTNDDHKPSESQLDEHVWTSPLNAALITAYLVEVLAELDPDNAPYFRANAAAYMIELEALHYDFSAVVAEGLRDIIIFGDRFPFRYLAHTYGLIYYAAFDGCCSNTQASPATVAYLIEKVQQENIPVVFHIEFSDKSIANVIAEATGAELLELHSLHNVSQEDFSAGVTYLELMRRNVEQLRKALN